MYIPTYTQLKTFQRILILLYFLITVKTFKYESKFERVGSMLMLCKSKNSGEIRISLSVYSPFTTALTLPWVIHIYTFVQSLSTWHL